ncbi:TonB-dependent siderophore receptor [Sphingomonas sp. CCH5-D11]|uniref:TonB-dependent siderophore receptor n=1 Tax=Sphingomonas sp. CCH5-D11 TaxID=1768786 RepID=UPI000AE0B205|nr:TonB-dependent receptor [Sphingomonas sp. CCH5-D11]
MRISTMLLVTTAMVTALPTHAFASVKDEAASPAAYDTAESDAQVQVEEGGARRSGDIVVVGKSYGREVGKTITPLKDVPNTVTVIEREQIEAQNLFTLEDALTATNGITVNGIGSEDPSYFSRGFAISNYLVDGVPTLSFNFPGVVPDLFAYDRLEVLRGPAGLFSGSGNPSGSINLVRKRPLETFKLQGSAGYGTYDNVRLELDVSAPLGDRAGVRAGVMAQDQDQFFDWAHRNRLNAFAVGSIEIGDRTTVTFGGSYDRFKPSIQSGLPGYAGGTDGSEGRLLDVRRSTYLGADWNRFRSETWTAFAEVAHRISDRWTLRATGLFTDVDRTDIYSYVGNAAITAANRGISNHVAYYGDSKSQTRSFDFNGVGSFRLFGQEQTLILGVDYQAQDYDSYYTRLSGYARVDVFNPVSPVEPPLNPYGPLPYYPVQGTNAVCPGSTVPIVPAPANCVIQNWGATRTVIEQYGTYGQLRLQPLAGLTLVGGGRLTWWEQTLDTLLPSPQPGQPQNIDERFTPYAGIVWDVTENLNIYGSYADSFTPQAAPAGRTRVGGGEVQPLIGSQYEIGSKLALMDDRLLLSAAVYQIEQTNRLFNPPEDQTIYLQVGKVRARGVEAEATGEILPGWRVNGGYTYTKTEYLEDTQPQYEGLSLTPIIPKHMIKAFTNYTVPGGALMGASVGGSVTWFSETSGGNPSIRVPVTAATPNGLSISSLVRQPSYAVVDLRAGYRISPQVSVSVNVNNLLDKNYYARISSTGRGNYYGSPRTVFATLRFAYP